MKINDRWSRGAWSDEENERLTQGINAHGYRCVLVWWFGALWHLWTNVILPIPSWTLVSEVVGSRSPDRMYCFIH